MAVLLRTLALQALLGTCALYTWTETTIGLFRKQAAEVLKIMQSDYDTVLAAGQGKLMGKIVRIGHMGIVEESDIDAAVDALEKTLDRLGYKKPASIGA